MYCASRFRRIVVHPCVVLVFCLCVVTCVVTPVDGLALAQNGKNDTNPNPKSVKKVLKESGNEPAVGGEKNISSDILSNDPSQKQTSLRPVAAAEDNNNDTLSNFSSGSPTWLNSIKSGALERTGFVALGIMSILLFFFIIRAIRIRRKKSKSRKYGVITSTASDMEMEPLDRGDDDEEETTLFDAQQHKYSLK